MNEKTLLELEVGDVIKTTHGWRKPAPRASWRKYRMGRGRTNRSINIAGHKPRECLARIFQINCLFGHTYELKYVCLCKRVFSERVKNGEQFETVMEADWNWENFKR